MKKAAATPVTSYGDPWVNSGPWRLVGQAAQGRDMDHAMTFKRAALGADEIRDLAFSSDVLADVALRSLRQQAPRELGLLDGMRALAGRGDRACTALLDHMHTLPRWLDYDRLAVGARMVQRNAPQFSLALTYGALPLAFAHPSSAAVFAATGDFARGVSDRLRLSAPLFFGAAQVDSLRPGRPAFLEALRVRLVHAHVRAALAALPGWDSGAYGVPLSSLQMAAGPAFFGTQVVCGMRALGACIESEDAQAHRMTYRYVTYLLGGDERLLGATDAEQCAIDNLLLPSAVAPDPRGRELMGHLMAGLRRSPQTRRIPSAVQRRLFRLCLGDSWSDALGVPSCTAGEVRGGLLRILRVHGQLARPGGASAPSLQRLGARWLARRVAVG